MTIVPNETLVVQIIIFLVLMVLLDKILFKPMLRLLNERKARTVGRRERASEAEGEAVQILENYESKIAEARAEADKLRQELVKQGEAERNRITETASAEAEKTITELKARVDQEGAKAKEALKAEIENLANVMAEKIIGRAV